MLLMTNKILLFFCPTQIYLSLNRYVTISKMEVNLKAKVKENIVKMQDSKICQILSRNDRTCSTVMGKFFQGIDYGEKGINRFFLKKKTIINVKGLGLVKNNSATLDAVSQIHELAKLQISDRCYVPMQAGSLHSLKYIQNTSFKQDPNKLDFMFKKCQICFVLTRKHD